jgi:hypothetical protein
MDTNFDPDAYLAEKDAPFDPDTYLAEKQSPLETQGRAALRNFPLAQQAVAGVKGMYAPSGQGTKAYSDELQHLTEAAEQGKAQNPWSYRAGSLIGAALPMFIPGAGELAEAAPIAMNALMGAGQALSDTNIVKNPGKAATEAGIGGAVGAGIGKLGQWFGKQLPTSKELISSNTEKTLQIPPRRLSNVVGKDIEGGLGDINSTMHATTLPDGRPLVELSDSAMRRADKVGKAVDMYGKQIGDVVGQIKADIPAEDLMQSIENIKTTSSGLKTHSVAADEINDMIAENADKQANISFEKLRDLTKEAWDKVQFDPATGNVTPESRKAIQVWQLLRDKQDEIVKSTRPDLFPQFAQANDHYSNLVGLQKAVNSVGLREAAKKPSILGNLNPLTLLTNIGNGIGKISGADKAIQNLPLAMNPYIKSGAAISGKLPKNIPQAELINYLQNKFGKKGQ